MRVEVPLAPLEVVELGVGRGVVPGGQLVVLLGAMLGLFGVGVPLGVELGLVESGVVLGIVSGLLGVLGLVLGVLWLLGVLGSGGCADAVSAAAPRNRADRATDRCFMASPWVFEMRVGHITGVRPALPCAIAHSSAPRGISSASFGTGGCSPHAVSD
jgi:hypothetical protein